MKRLYIFAVLLSSLLGSCGYLDKSPETEGMDFDMIFKGDPEYYKRYCEYLVLNPFFLRFTNDLRPIGSYDCLSDNSISTATYPGVPSIQAQEGNFYSLITNGDSPATNNGTWEQIWRHVRVANNGIVNIDSYTGDEQGRRYILGMCYFYRAFSYMELCRRWGGMPYLTEPLATDANFDLPRLSMQETYTLAAEDFATAATYLEDVIPLSENQHPTRIAALAMRSRVLLYAASDLARNETGAAGEDLWEEAAMAADQAIKAAEATQYYELVSMDNYKFLFRTNDDNIFPKEVLMGRWYKAVGWGSASYINNLRPPGQLAGKYAATPNQTLVDCFEMQATGLPITDPLSGYNEQDPYTGRDPRLSINIMHNEATVLTKKLEIYQLDETVSPAKMGSRDCVIENGQVKAGFTSTGYYANKFIGEKWNSNTDLTWPEIRLAEVYLNFAEAANEAWSDPKAVPAGCTYSAEQAINKVRNRATLPNIAEKFLTQAPFRQRTRDERRVELAFEEHRLFDIRRWKVAHLPENRDVYGIRVTKVGKSATYPRGFKYERSETPICPRIFEQKHYLFAIKRNDTYTGPNFKQNPGWSTNQHKKRNL